MTGIRRFIELVENSLPDPIPVIYRKSSDGVIFAHFSEDVPGFDKPRTGWVLVYLDGEYKMMSQQNPIFSGSEIATPSDYADLLLKMSTNTGDTFLVVS